MTWKRFLLWGSTGLLAVGTWFISDSGWQPQEVDPPGRPARAGQRDSAGEELPPPGQELERFFETRTPHRYTVDLAAGEFVEFLVEQRGIDVAVTVREPAGELYSRTDSPNGQQGSERVVLLAEDAGRYRIEVVPLAGNAEGSYGVGIATRRPASPRDRKLVTAARIFAQAEELRRENRGEDRRAAVGKYREAIALFGALQEWREEAKAWRNLGATLGRLGERRAALEAYQRVLEILDGREDPDQLRAGTLNSAGAIHRYLGEFDAAQRCYDTALGLFRQRGYVPGEAVTLNNLGRLSSARGAMHEAQRWYEQALRRWQQLADRDKEIKTLTNLGGVSMALGEVKRALDHLTHAWSRLPAGADSQLVADLLDQLGDVYAQTGERSEALEHFQRALRLHRVTGNRRSEAYTLNGLGRLHRRLAEYDAALDAFASAQRRFEALDDQRGQAIVLHDLGWLYEIRGEPEQAASYYDRSLPLARAVRYRDGEAATLLGIARIERRRGELDAAWSRIQEALALVESLRSDAGRPDLRSALFATKQDYYDLAIAVLAELHQREPSSGWDALAFAVAERSRARVLLDALPELGKRTPIEPALLARERRLGEELNAAERQRWELLRRSQETAGVERRLRALLAEYRTLRGEIRLAGGEALPEPRPLTLEDVQAQVLDRDTLLLQYHLGRERSQLWAVTSTASHSFTLTPREQIEELARGMHKCLRSRHRLGRSSALRAAARLSDALLAPVAELLGERRLLIVAEGALQYVPFGALPRPGSDPAEPLVVSHEIVYAPSASVIALMRRVLAERPLASQPLAVLADPVFHADDPRVGSSGAGSAVGDDPADLQRSLRDLDIERFERLPFTRREAEEIVALVSGDAFRAFDFEAGKEIATNGLLADYRIIHFATHGVLNTTYPELSGLVLSLVDRQGRPRDGFLRAHEISQLELSADLVVLSACQTALGAQIRGEGMVGLTHAFLRAGAGRVLVSLWNVGDRATAELISRFYRAHLVRGLPPAAALRQAQISMWRERPWSAPYFWAGFVLQGEWR